MTPTVKGAFLWTLESELAADSEEVKRAILVQGLFSRQICLTEFQALDNWGVVDFFLHHEHRLGRMLRELEDYEIPIIGTCARIKAGWDSLLDSRLTPSVNDQFPSYCSMLKPEKNQRLREGYEGLNSQQRRERFFKEAGPEVRRHLNRLTEYFEPCKEKTIVEGTGLPQEKLYITVEDEIKKLKSSDIIRFTPTDTLVTNNILTAISEHPKDGKQSREKLHWAIYEGQSPAVHKKKIYATQAETHTDDRRHAWRYFVNSVYNYNLAKNLGLRPALNSEWFEEVRQLVPPERFTRKFKVEEKSILELDAPLYFEHLDLDFVIKVRKERAFYDRIKAMEDARASGSWTQLEPSFKDHLQSISQSFAKHLRAKGRKDLAVKALTEVYFPSSDEGAILGATLGEVVRLLGCWTGQPSYSAMELVDGAGVGALVTAGANRLFRGCEVESPDFKNFTQDLGDMSGADKM